MDNTSGQGKGAAVPEEVKGLCWGGFFWGGIWGIFNRVWLSLLTFVPIVGFVFQVVLLFKGREWAWKSRPWESAERFNTVQRRWSIAGLIPLLLGVLGIVAAIVLPMFLGGGEPPPPPPKPAAMKPAAPKPAAPKPVPKPAPAPVPSAPAAEAPAVAPAPATPSVSEARPEHPAATPSHAPAPTMAARRANKPAVAKADRAAPAPRVRATFAAPKAPAQGMAAAVAPAAPVPEPRTYAPRYNDVMTAVLKPDRAGVIELLDLGRWVDKPDSSGTTPLQAAVRNRDTGMVELLLSRGANVNASSHGVTALAIARASGDAAMVSLLQRHGAR